MNISPLFTIITVVFNNKLGLQKTVNSVLEQQFADIEFIIIDGGSTDGTVQYIKEFAPKLAYCISEPDTGIYNAMNKGIAAATGQYLLFLNSGDYLASSDVLQKVSNAINPNAKVIGCDVLYADGSRLHKKHSPHTVGLSYFINRVIYHPCTFVHKTLFEKYGGYNEERKIVADWEFFLLVLGVHQEPYQYVQVVTTVFDQTGISSNPMMKQLQEEERMAVYEKYLPQPFYNELYVLQQMLAEKSLSLPQALDFYNCQADILEQAKSLLQAKRYIKLLLLCFSRKTSKHNRFLLIKMLLRKLL